MGLGVLKPLITVARVVLEEERHKSTEGLCRVAFAPMVGVEHVSDFWCPNRAYEANDAWRCIRGSGLRGRGKELNGKIPIDCTVKALFGVVSLIDSAAMDFAVETYTLNPCPGFVDIV